MTTNRSAEYLSGLVHELRRLPHETEWVEFKKNHANPEMIGEDIAALSNGAALHSREKAYMLWGVEDETHVVVGTDFVPGAAKGKGNSLLEPWLLAKLRPQVNFGFHIAEVDGQRVVVLEIEPSTQHPVAFENERFIRVGSATKKLKDHPEKERALWRTLERTNFESGVAYERARSEDVLLKLDYPEYFSLLDAPLPDGRGSILEALQGDRLIVPCDAGGWNITNLGAILLAKNLRDFSSVWRKTLRVIQYRGEGRTETQREQEFPGGYATEFDSIVNYIVALTPATEVIDGSFRRAVPTYPLIALRELVANALIHQDFSVAGAGPTVEIFDNRIEITNPGEPLVDTERFLDTPPKSRNEILAAMMRRFDICEERGTGIDKAVLSVELHQLPAPLFEAPEAFTRIFLFARKPLSAMDRPERVRACYLHACLRYVANQSMNNASIRERFGIATQNAAIASRYLREALDDGYIVISNPSAGARNRTYLPFWANRHEIGDQVL